MDYALVLVKLNALSFFDESLDNLGQSNRILLASAGVDRPIAFDFEVKEVDQLVADLFGESVIPFHHVSPLLATL